MAPCSILLDYCFTGLGHLLFKLLPSTRFEPTSLGSPSNHTVNPVFSVSINFIFAEFYLHRLSFDCDLESSSSTCYHCEDCPLTTRGRHLLPRYASNICICSIKMALFPYLGRSQNISGCLFPLRQKSCFSLLLSQTFFLTDR